MKYVRRLTVNSNVCMVKQKKKQDAGKKKCERKSVDRDEESKKWSKTKRNKMTDVQKKE